MDIKILVGNYRTSNASSFLAYLDKLSEKRRDGGLLHGGHIHYIQTSFDFDNFVLKAAIKEVLDRVPEVFPLDLPEQVEKAGELEPTEEQKKAFKEINEGLLLPIGGWEILQIIKLAREYAFDNDSQT